MAYTDFDISMMFEKLWEIYPRKDRPAAGQKALGVALRTGAEYKQIEQAVKIYCMESANDEFHYHFVNFINEDHWKDIISYHKDAAGHVKILEGRKKLAYVIIKHWNDTCLAHWCKCLDSDMRVGMVTNALANKFFRENWKNALDKAAKIFYHTLHEKDKYRNLSLTLRWFCRIIPDKHTVLQLIEGEYGKPYDPPKRRVKQNESLNEDDKVRLIKDIEDVFGDTEWLTDPVVEPEEEPKINKEMKKLVEALEIDDPFELDE